MASTGECIGVAHDTFRMQRYGDDEDEAPPRAETPPEKDPDDPDATTPVKIAKAPTPHEDRNTRQNRIAEGQLAQEVLAEIPGLKFSCIKKNN